MKNTICLFLFLVVLISPIYRISQDIKTANVIQQIVVLPDNSIAVAFSNIIQILQQDYQTLKQQIQIKNSVSDIFLSQINGVLVFVDSGTINSVTTDQIDLTQTVTYRQINYRTQLKRWKDQIIIPPLDSQNQLLSVNISNLTIKYISTSDSYTLTGQPLASSNIYIDNNDSYYFVTIDQNLIPLLYQGSSSSFSNIYNFTEDVSFFQDFTIPLSSLDVFSLSGQQYIGLVWQPTALQFQYDLITKLSNGTYQNYSSISTLLQVQAAKYISYNQILVSDTYCQISTVNPLNPQAQKQAVPGIDPSIIVSSISESQTAFIGNQNNNYINNFYTYSYLYTLDPSSHQFTLKTNLYSNTSSGYGFGSSSFFANDAYIVVLQLQANLPSNITKTQLSLYSLSNNSFIDQSAITDVYSRVAKGYFSAGKNSNYLFVVTAQYYLALYNLESGGLNIKDSIDLNISSVISINSIGPSSVVLLSTNSTSFTLTAYSVYPSNGTLYIAGSVSQSVQADYQISAVLNNVIVVSPTNLALYADSPIFYYDWNLASLALSFSDGSRVVSTTEIVAYSSSDILLKKSDNSLQHWTLSNQQFTYSGGFYYGLFGQTSISINYYRVIFLPLQDVLYIDYQSKLTVTAFNFALSSPTKVRLGQILSNGTCEGSSPLQFQQFINTGSSPSYIGYDSTYNKVVKYNIHQSSIALADQVSLNITVDYLRLSSDNQWLILWGKDDVQTDVTRLQVRNFSQLSSIKYERLFPNFVDEYIYDGDYETDTDQVFLTTNNTSNNLKIYLFSNNQKPVDSSTSLSYITVLATGMQSVVYSGIDSISGQAAPYFLFHPINNVAAAKIVQVGCTIKLLDLSSTQNSIVGVCDNNTLFYYNVSSTLTKTFDLGRIATKVSFLNDTFIVITLNGQIITKDLTASPSQSQTTAAVHMMTAIDFIKQIDITSTANTSTAIDQQKQYIAYSPNSTNVVITDFSGTIVDQFTLPGGQNVVSLAFNSNNELLVGTDQSNLIVWTTLPCPQNFSIVNSLCECSATFIASGSSCVCPNSFIEQNQVCVCPSNLVSIGGVCQCPNNQQLLDGSCSCPSSFVLNNGFCGCSDGQVEQSSSCQSCSFMCSSCNSTDALDCQTFGAWFYVLLVVLILIVAGLVVLIVLKVRNSKKKREEEEYESLKEDDKSKDPLQQSE